MKKLIMLSLLFLSLTITTKSQLTAAQLNQINILLATRDKAISDQQQIIISQSALIKNLNERMIAEENRGVILKSKYQPILKGIGGVDTIDLDVNGLISNVKFPATIDLNSIQIKNDSFSNAFKLNTKDITQLYANDVNETAIRYNADTSLKSAQKTTDNFLLTTNGAVRSNTTDIKKALLKLDSVNRKIDSLPIVDLTSIKSDIVDLKRNQGLTTDQLKSLADKIEAIKTTIPKGVTLNVNGTLTY